MEYFEFRAMNTDIVLAAEGDARAFERGFRWARNFVETSEARFTRFAETSELAQLNRAAGEWFAASPELYELISAACEYVEQTEGLFDPSILDALERAGYDKSMDEIWAHGVSPRSGESSPRTSDSERTVDFDPDAHAIRLSPGTRLDLGGIAKGWIAERAARVLAGFSNACAVSAGGDLFAIGLPAGQTAWEVGLDDPREEGKTLAVLSVGAGAVATSSITKRRWRQNGQVQHHLIDPRTGVPAETDWLSVTAIAPRAAQAEVFAKALLIAGSRDAERIAARGKDISFIAVDQAGQLWGSNEAQEFLNVGHS